MDHITVIDTGSWPNEFTYSTILGQTSTIIQVIACQSIFIELSEIPGNPKTLSYEIALGIDMNSKTEIRSGVDGAVLATHEGEVLHCLELKVFWLQWDRGMVEVGTGDVVGTDQLL